MKTIQLINETSGTRLDTITTMEPILFCNISGEVLNKEKYNPMKNIRIAMLLLTLADSFKYDLTCDIDIARAKLHLTKSVYQN